MSLRLLSSYWAPCSMSKRNKTLLGRVIQVPLIPMAAGVPSHVTLHRAMGIGGAREAGLRELLLHYPRPVLPRMLLLATRLSGPQARITDAGRILMNTMNPLS